MINGQSAGKDFAYLLGVYFGDASIVKRTENCYTFTIEAIDKDFLERTVIELGSFTGKTPNIFERSRKTSSGKTVYALTLSDKLTFKQFIDDTGGCKYIPDYVADWPEENRISFLEGVLDSDGWVSKRTTKFGISQFRMGYSTSYSWTYDIKRLMESVGILCGNIGEYILKSGRKMLRFDIQMKSFVKSKLQFTSKRKQDRVDQYEMLKMRSNPQRLYAMTNQV